MMYMPFRIPGERPHYPDPPPPPAPPKPMDPLLVALTTIGCFAMALVATYWLAVLRREHREERRLPETTEERCEPGVGCYRVGR